MSAALLEVLAAQVAPISVDDLTVLLRRDYPELKHLVDDLHDHLGRMLAAGVVVCARDDASGADVFLVSGYVPAARSGTGSAP